MKYPLSLLRPAVAALALLPSILLPPSAAAGPPPGNDLVVLLEAGSDAPTPEAVVAAAARGDVLPAGLGVGGPTAADFVISRRAAGDRAEAFRLDPEHPQAKLQRYVVLSYPAPVSLDAVAAALERNPHVEWVGPVRYARVSAVEPNDPRFDDNPGGVPRPADEHQWGSYALDLPEAWEYTKGHAYVGILDLGIDSDHEDLRAFDAWNNYLGGNFRPHFSWDYQLDNATVDDNNAAANHGTHVAGIVGATANNGKGVAGACWDCSLIISQVSNDGIVPQTVLAEAIEESIKLGASILNMSLGYRTATDCNASPSDPLCVALDFVDRREVVLAAASGNNNSFADWPSTDPRVFGAGGIEPDGSHWDEGCSGDEGCGSNSDPSLFSTPAKSILSTFYLGHPYAPNVCTDDLDGVVDGYGPCTGTSMAAPYLAASAAVVRSVNPLLSHDDVRTLLAANLETPPGWNFADGQGKPNVHQTVLDALGRVGGQVIPNRLTPLFSLYNFDAEDHAYTIFPQVGSSWTRAATTYWPQGSDVPGYQYFPDGNCFFVPCPARAEVYVFGGDRSPNGHPLVPLYRMSYVGDFNGTNPNNADHVYTTEAAGIEAFADVGYRLDGVEGYIYQRCSPEPSCIPTGATRLYRYYNAARDDWALFPESKLADYQAEGYAAQSGANPWIGYVYENVDTDGDELVDGFESLIGTNPYVADTDGDGATDGAEIGQFPYSDPLG